MKNFLAIQIFSPKTAPNVRAAVEEKNRRICDCGKETEYVALESPDETTPGAIADALKNSNAKYFVAFPENFAFWESGAPEVSFDELIRDLDDGTILFPVDCAGENARWNPERPNPRIAFGRVGDEARNVFERWQIALDGFDASRFASEFWIKIWPYTNGLVLLKNYYRIAADGGYLLRRVDFATLAAQISKDAKKENEENDGRVETDVDSALENRRSNARSDGDRDDPGQTPNGDGTSGGARGGLAGDARASDVPADSGAADERPGTVPATAENADAESGKAGNDADGRRGGNGDGAGNGGRDGNGDGTEPVKPTKKRRTKKAAAAPAEKDA